MERILVIEDSRSTARMITRILEHSPGFPCDVAPDMATARKLIAERGKKYFVALCDLNLPDAPHGEAVEMVLNHSIPSIVVSASINQSTRMRVARLPIADYIVKRGPEDLLYLQRLVRRIYRNREIKAMVVDDSSTYREQIKYLLSRQQLTVFEAENGQQALEVLEKHPDMRLVLTDYHMPVMDGYTLTSEIRKQFSTEELAVIAITISDQDLAPLFLKSGANDFVPKSSSAEELICRINMNLDMLDLIIENKELASRDALTGLLNRGVLHDRGEELFASAQAENKVLKAAMLDIDHFKKVNDTYGHHAGDMAIRQLSTMLSKWFPEPCSVYRFGGEEFCILFDCAEKPAAIATRLEAFRKEVAGKDIVVEGETFRVTISIGLFTQQAPSFDVLLNTTDSLLYEAKESGRNRLVTA